MASLLFYAWYPGSLKDSSSSLLRHLSMQPTRLNEIRSIADVTELGGAVYASANDARAVAWVFGYARRVAAYLADCADAPQFTVFAKHSRSIGARRRRLLAQLDVGSGRWQGERVDVVVHQLTVRL